MNNKKQMVHYWSVMIGFSLLSGVLLAQDTSFKKSDVLKIMEKIADWQLQSLKENATSKLGSWENAVGYMGFYELSRISKNKAYLNTLFNRVGNSHLLHLF